MVRRLPPLAAADGADDDDGGSGGGDDVAEGLQEFMIRANGRICILLDMSLPNGCLHTEVMMVIIKHGERVSCSVHRHKPLWSCLNHTRREKEGGKDVKIQQKFRVE